MARKKSYKLNSILRSSKLRIAMVQLEGPLPHGKHQSPLGSRDTLVWKSSIGIKQRIAKACNILDSLNQFSAKVDIVVFPEYSIPVENALSALQKKANQYKQIIIPGSDNIHQADIDRIYNKCPVIIPERKNPIWVMKRKLSQWEHGLVDEPEKVSVPFFTWEAENKTYWFSVYICLDFEQARDEIRKGGGIFIVPMCSRDISSFHSWADNALRLENGTATVLCNCVGAKEVSVGQSGVVAVVPGGKSLQPAFSLSDSKEAVAVFEIDCKQLAPPKKTNPDYRFPLGRRSFYLLGTESGITDLSYESDSPKDSEIRGVINPSIFKHLGKTMRMAFLPVDNYWDIEKKLEGRDFEVLAILGQQDILATHLGENREQMIYDVNRIANWKPVNHNFKPGEELTNAIHDNFPFFRVDVFFKVLGVPIDPTGRYNRPIPSIEEAVKIMKLGSDWNDDGITKDERRKFLRNGWILTTTDRQPGAISAIMTIYLQHETANVEHRRAILEDQVLPELIKKDVVTSIYRGRAQELDIHYLLRISASVDSLYSLIREIHELASKSKISLITTTYVVVNKLSNLSLEKAVLAPILPVDEKNYRDAHILPTLSDEDRILFIYLSEERQRPLIKRIRRIQEALSDLHDANWLQGQQEELDRKLIRGMLHDDFILLKEPHDSLQIRAEKQIKDFIRKNVKDDQFDNWKASLNLQSGRKKDNLSFTERLKLAIRYIEETGERTDRLELLNSLSKTTKIRNSLVHGDFEKIEIDEYCDALPIYCRFLSKWED
jgi:predicted amidohydrolase